jgi:hypothetical protein
MLLDRLTHAVGGVQIDLTVLRHGPRYQTGASDREAKGDDGRTNAAGADESQPVSSCSDSRVSRAWARDLDLMPSAVNALRRNGDGHEQRNQDEQRPRHWTNRCEVLAILADWASGEVVDVDRATPLMKRLLIFLVSLGFAVAVCGGLLMSLAQVGTGGIGSVSFGFSEAIVEMAAGIVLVIAILAGRALLTRFRSSNTLPKS